MAQLKASETHKSMLQRSRWMLTAAALEKDDVLVSHPFCGFAVAMSWKSVSYHVQSCAVMPAGMPSSTAQLCASCCHASLVAQVFECVSNSMGISHSVCHVKHKHTYIHADATSQLETCLCIVVRISKAIITACPVIKLFWQMHAGDQCPLLPSQWPEWLGHSACPAAADSLAPAGAAEPQKDCGHELQ